MGGPGVALMLEGRVLAPLVAAARCVLRGVSTRVTPLGLLALSFRLPEGKHYITRRIGRSPWE